MAPPFQAALDDRAVIGVAGPDARSFLQGLLTQDTETLRAGELAYGALLTPQGRLRWDLFLFGEDEGVAIDVEAGARDALVQALTLYRLRAKVEIARDDRRVCAAWSSLPTSEHWRPDPRLPALGWRRLTSEAEGLDDYRAHRIEHGVADPAEDGLEPLYPIEANLDLLNGVDFKKGCFVGQETTSRMKRRGPVKTRIAPITYSGAPLLPGSAVMADELRAGVVLSGVAGRSLALLRIDRAFGASMNVGDQPVELDVQDWLEPHFNRSPDLQSNTVRV